MLQLYHISPECSQCFHKELSNMKTLAFLSGRWFALLPHWLFFGFSFIFVVLIFTCQNPAVFSLCCVLFPISKSSLPTQDYVLKVLKIWAIFVFLGRLNSENYYNIAYIEVGIQFVFLNHILMLSLCKNVLQYIIFKKLPEDLWVHGSANCDFE